MKKSYKIFETTVEKIFLISAFICIISVFFITLFIIKEGLPLFKVTSLREFLFSAKWKPTGDPPTYGILSFILGSLWITFGALILAVPIGVGVGIFMAEMAKGRGVNFLRSVVSLLAGIPSVIYGLFGYIALSPIVRNIFGDKSPSGLGILTASLVLAIMTLPTIINITEVSIRAVPQELKEASLGLGATHWITIYKVILPAARSGILAGVVLGIGRAIGETMAVMMVAGNAITVPRGPLSLGRTLTMNIATDMAYASDYHYTSLFTTALVLFVFIMAINLFVQYLIHRAIEGEK